MTIRINDIFSEDQLKTALKIANTEKQPARRICAEITAPGIGEINRKTGQENDPMYMAYMLEYYTSMILAAGKGEVG